MKTPAPRNRTLTCSLSDAEILSKKLLSVQSASDLPKVLNQVVNADTFAALPHFPRRFADLVILDPPYNLTKDFHGIVFRERSGAEYQDWFRALLDILSPTMAPTGTLYVCADWRTSGLVQPLLEERFHVRNRITWEREKGRGAKSNWKNNTEDIWFCTVGETYTFNVAAVKLKRRVIAPYRNVDGQPKDWKEENSGNFRLTHPSNIWTDITVPFWSMPENTNHPTQKPEKLIAKLVLASSNEGDIVLDPFLGSGTSAVVAAKLGRRYVGVEISPEYCVWSLKRLEAAERCQTIQGYADGVFWERNSLAEQPKQTGKVHAQGELC